MQTGKNEAIRVYFAHMASHKAAVVKNKKAAPKRSSWGFDVRELDTSVRPQDDFYAYVNKKWCDAHPIPQSEAHWGAFMALRYDTDKKLHAMLDELVASNQSKKGSAEQLISDFYRSGMDLRRRNTLGVEPLKPLLTRVYNLRTSNELPALLGNLHRLGVGVIFGSDVGQDSKNTDRYAFHLGQDGLGMPDREYYLKNDAESVRVREAYSIHVEKLFRLMGYSPAAAIAARDTLLRIETELARASMKKEEMRDPEKTYNKMTLPALKKLAANFDWNPYLRETGLSSLPYAIVMQPDFFKTVNTMLTSVSLDDWKTYLRWHIVNDFSGALSNRFIKQSFSFYGTVLSGTKVMRPLWRRVLGTVNGGLGELIGKIYVEKYFPKEAKKKMDVMVDDLFTAFEARIKTLDWMSAPTKRKALQKLKAITRKIGYPRKWKSYAGLVIRGDDFVGNIMRMNEYEHRRAIKKLGGPIDREEWFMYPQTVNAYFAPNLNDIVFPAAILQPPFFMLEGDDGVNYGAIGAVIGHEITHGFDDEGSKYDSRGNLKSWWSAEDRKRFEAKAKKVERQFSAYKVADGVPVNGKLTLGENIADLGGLSISYDAYQIQLARTGRKDLDGLTPEQRFFIAFAIFERENRRPEAVKTQVLTDPHSPGVFRINGPVSNFDRFYEAFSVQPGDALYRAPKDREMVW
jgi:putative endopeptidase